VLVCAGIYLSAPATPTHGQDGRLVLAFYYAWYDQNTWTSGTVTDRPLQPYNSSDRAAIERQVAQAHAAGIDALIESWYGPQEANNQTETNFRMLLDAAAGKGMHAGVAFETTGPFFPDRSSVTEALRYLLSVHAQHPAYLRYQGRPVIFFWRQQRFGVDEWASIRSQVDPDHQSVWIAEGVDIAYQSVFDGHYLYSIAWSPDVARTLADWGAHVRRYETQHNVNRLWVATVMPGYDDTRAGRAAAFAVNRRGGGYYRDTWAAATASRPDWVIITSFNEWVEGTMIEPSVSYGDLYLNLTRELAAQFKGAPPPPAAPIVSPAAPDQADATPTATLTATPSITGPQVRADETVRIRSGPGTGYDRIGRLRKGEVAAVVGLNSERTWWQIKIPTGAGVGWVSAEFVTFSGEAGEVPVVSTPTVAASPTLTMTARPRATATISSTLPLSPVMTPTPAPSMNAAVPQPGTPTPTQPWILHPMVSATPAKATLPAPSPSLTQVQPEDTATSVAAWPMRSPAPSADREGSTPTRPAVPMPRLKGEAEGGSPVLLWLGGGSLLGAAVLAMVLRRVAPR
jgi:uncharacterized protein YraI